MVSFQENEKREREKERVNEREREEFPSRAILVIIIFICNVNRFLFGCQFIKIFLDIIYTFITTTNVNTNLTDIHNKIMNNNIKEDDSTRKKQKVESSYSFSIPLDQLNINLLRSLFKAAPLEVQESLCKF